MRLFVVALVGQFQAYISDLMDELGDNLPDDWEKLAPLQKRYVAVQVRRRLERVLTTYSEDSLTDDKTRDQFKKAVLGCSEWSQKPSVLATSTHRAELHGFLNDNSGKSLDRAVSQFRPDGMRFSDWLHKHYHSYIGIFGALDNAILLRNEAAHGQIGQRVTLHDARMYRTIVYRLVDKADRYLETVVGNTELEGPKTGDVEPRPS